MVHIAGEKCSLWAIEEIHRRGQRCCNAVFGKLHGNDVDLEEVASAVGYADGATFRTLLRERLLGRGVRELRAELR